MKTLVNRIAVFAAAAVVLGTMAYGQSRKMTAEIPFAFHVGHAYMPAGTYTLVDQATPGVAIVRNSQSKKSAAAMGLVDINTRTASGSSLVFACGAAGCALSAVKSPAGTCNYYPAEKLSARDREAIAMVEIPMVGSGGE